MQQTMENYTLLNKILTLAFATLLFIGCEPNEDKLEFNLEKQQVEKVFSFQDYCKEEYDSIFLVYPYFNTVHIDYTSLKMSNSLRGICNANINFDHFSTILFIKNGKVEAYSEIKCVDADFDSREVEKHYIFPIDQKFIMDKERNIHICNE
jgi:hypothetical protein